MSKELYKIRTSSKSVEYFTITDNGDDNIRVYNYPRETYRELISKEDFCYKYKKFHGFTKDDRSTFSYWFSHWCAFQLTALNMKRWKFKYLFHDFEKPWLKLFRSYKFVQKWHRNHNPHHLEYGLRKGWDKIDWEALVIDWECSRLTKQEAQLDAYETMELELSKDKWRSYEKEIAPRFYKTLRELGL